MSHTKWTDPFGNLIQQTSEHGTDTGNRNEYEEEFLQTTNPI